MRENVEMANKRLVFEAKQNKEFLIGIDACISAIGYVKQTVKRYGLEHEQSVKAFSALSIITHDLCEYYADCIRKNTNMIYTSSEFKKILKEKIEGETVGQAAKRLGIGRISLASQGPVVRNVKRKLCKLDDGRIFNSAKEAVNVLIHEGRVPKPVYLNWSGYSILNQNKIKYERVTA